MASGGDTYYRFVSATANYDLGIPMDEVVMEYINTVLGGKITAEKYGAPAGRITIVNEPVVEPEPEPETVTYVVVRGDTLWRIAARYLGSGYKWKLLYDANKDIISNPNLIYVGQTLMIPLD